jgi:hypothetical protein
MKDPAPHTDGKVTFGAAGPSGEINLPNKEQYTCGFIVGASILPRTAWDEGQTGTSNHIGRPARRFRT